MLRDFVRLAKPFWTSEERGRAIWTAVLIVVLTLTMVGLSVILNILSGVIFNAIQVYDFKAFLRALEHWTGFAFLYCIAGVYQSYASMALTIRWRRWMSDHYLQSWLGNKTFYYWQITGHPTDNPDQRISEDIRDFISTNDMNSGAIPLITGLLQQAATLLAFVTLLWKVGGTLSLQHGHLLIHGYLVYGALIYALIGSLLIAKIGNPLITLSFSQQRYEADFRFGLVRLREYGESIALSQGEAAERPELMGKFGSIQQNYYAIMNRVKKINAFTIGYNQIANVLPFFLCSPVYFAHRMTLGGLNQAAGAFGSVQGAVSYFINAYTYIAQWRAVIQRLTGFTETIQAAHSLSERPGVARSTSDRDPSLRLQDLSLSLPDGRSLFQDLDLTLEAGHSTLISGPSGTGKSTLLRAIAGIWPYTKGRIQTPTEFQAMMLPQKSYLPIGSLRSTLAYPQPADEFSDDAMRQALSRVRLTSLSDRLGEEQNWAQVLSPGEQQRIALARAFLHQPRWLFLDEATSALDEATEQAVYEGFAEALPDTTIVSIGHRSSLKPLHDTTVTLASAAAVPV